MRAITQERGQEGTFLRLRGRARQECPRTQRLSTRGATRLLKPATARILLSFLFVRVLRHASCSCALQELRELSDQMSELMAEVATTAQAVAKRGCSCVVVLGPVL